MKTQKGITIASLLIYVVALSIVVSVMALVMSFYNKNVIGMNDSGELNIELNKFVTQMVHETEEYGNEVINLTATTITFKNGNFYTFKDNRIYQNSIEITNYVKDFNANIENDGEKQILKIFILLEKGQAELSKILNYVITISKDAGIVSGVYPGTVQQTPGPVDENGLANKNITITTDEENMQIVIPQGFAPAILEGSNWTTSLPGQSGKVIGIMPYDQWKNITAEDINKGIVIVDHAITYDEGAETGTVPDFNEFVWVPISESSDFSFWYHEIEEVPTDDAFWEDTTTPEYINMISSVNIYKGFYIGRYEAKGRNNISKRGQAPSTMVGQGVAIAECASTSIDNMHLMHGIEWESTLNWLNGNAIISSSTAGETKIMELEDLTTNSETWGNYYDTIGDAASTPYEQRVKQNTGASEYWKANNIYDLAGNVGEWTYEYYNNTSAGGIRGGSFMWEAISALERLGKNRSAPDWHGEWRLQS